MRTPDGKECKYFYGDYYRGRNHEECRLLAAPPNSQSWTPDLCRTCPVPGILVANACQHMTLTATIRRPFPFIRRQVVVQAFCDKCRCPVTEPHIGCGECHSLPLIFTGETHDPDSAG